MLKKQVILSVVAIVAVLLLFMLPKVVVDNENESQNQTASTEENGNNQAETAEHVGSISEEVKTELTKLREAYKNSKNSENFTNFANSLIDRFAAANQYDSAARYAEELASIEPEVPHLRKAADMYYEAFTYAMEAEKTARMGEKARYFYEQVMTQDPADLDAKAKMAMTYVSSSTPMQGIQMLREVLEEDENNEMAIYNLGLLSMQSQQYDKAIDRFEKLVKLEPDNLQAQFLLGVSYFETGEKEKAKIQLLRVKEMDEDPSVQASVDEYLNQL
ncbi:tetratricopeptide repeat protein [Catalinimonas niigatensis]|uniref:tetratricopeptide repeat protein n=1 Tax=Catalinimonas niigatensis TaxID=1397264 RepID=UPI0026665AC7|nr:tetratricopeptide repeat protein [Catalinimonas niigatensis]WPP53501.1 tetratricopeptide repeat protein [Catalinimonas niigatensis]